MRSRGPDQRAPLPGPIGDSTLVPEIACWSTIRSQTCGCRPRATWASSAARPPRRCSGPRPERDLCASAGGAAGAGPRRQRRVRQRAAGWRTSATGGNGPPPPKAGRLAGPRRPVVHLRSRRPRGRGRAPGLGARSRGPTGAARGGPAAAQPPRRGRAERRRRCVARAADPADLAALRGHVRPQRPRLVPRRGPLGAQRHPAIGGPAPRRRPGWIASFSSAPAAAELSRSGAGRRRTGPRRPRAGDRAQPIATGRIAAGLS